MKAASSFIIEPVALDLPALPRPLDLAALFGNSRELQVEIGSGKGTFLVQQSALEPDVNYIGIEWSNWFFRYACDRLRRNNRTNVRMVRAEAGFFIREYIADASVSILHVYFPDPWPKKRHLRRRLIQDAFMPEVLRILRPGGRLQLVTDHADYFQQMCDVVGRSGLTVGDFAPPPSAAAGEVVGTNFERKFIKEGRTFNAMVGVKPA